MVASLPSRARFGVVSPASLATITIAVLFSTGVILYYFPNAISRTHEEPKEIFEPKERSRPKRRPEPCVTLRIFNVPIDRTRQSFEDELKAIAAQVPAFHDAKKTLKYVTLVRRDQMRACGTATFYTSLPNNTLAEQLQTISGQEEYPYKFDSEFYGITPLYEHESDSFVDLVAVTGLGGHAFGSWRSPNNDEMWLRDYLPTDIPNHRIIVYGYNTKLQGNESKQSIEDLGARFMESLAAFRIDTKTTQRPIIFIGHSLGGLLVKEALLCAYKGLGNHGNLHKACYAMLCFGVPNLGLRHDQLRTIVQDNPNEALVHSLIVDNDAEPSEYLRRISNEFSRVCTGYKYKVVNFFERNPTSTVQILEDGTLNRAGPKSLLVTKESATKIGLVAAAEEDNVSFDADHSALVKFESKDHEDYIIVKTRLCKLIEDSREVVANRFLEHSVRQPTSKSTDSCLQSLAFLEMNSRCHDIDTAHPGTCTWLENHPSFKDWESLPRALLWIRGKPGSGKSTLLKYTLAKTQREAQDPEVKVLVLSFFFNARGVELEKTLLGFYRCLSHQLLDKFPGALPDLVNRYAKQEKIFGPVGERWRWHEDELRDFLKTSLPEILELSSVTLFVDALDECGDDHARKLIGHLKDLLETLPKTTYNLRICVSCRHYPTLELGNGPNHGRTISVEHQNTADIGKYVRESLQNLDHQESIASLITSSARGVFLWAYLVVIQVLKLQLSGRGHRAMVQGIKKIPKDLDELYCKLLEDLTEDRTERETTLRLVQWICFAQRPLSTNELRWAVMIDPDNSHETLDEYRRSEVFIEDGNITTRINALSCGLAEVTPSGRVQFIHQSVKDFFNDHGLTTLTGRSSRANLIEANYCLARSCIRYMAMEEISKVESWAREKRDEKWYEKQYEKRHKIRQHREPKWNLDPVEESWELDVPLLQYAVSEWVKHAKATQGAEEVIPVDYLFGILSRPLNRLVDRWVALHQAIVGDYNQPEVGSTLLHVAAIYGLTDTLSAILVKPGVGKEDTDAKDENGRTPLMLAARYAHEAVVQGLLNAGADVKVRDRYGNTPLHFAAEHGNEAITQLLLTAKAEVNSQDASNRTPLYQAVGYEAVVNLLLSADADVNTRAYNGETPLFGAIRLREEATVWALLNAKAEVNLKDDEGNTPLSTAARHGTEAMVQRLLAAGAEVNSKSNQGNTPLSTAARHGSEAMVECLLAAGAEVDSKTNRGKTPLSIAARHGNEAIVQGLVAAGAKVRSEDDQGETLLSVAVRRGSEAMVQSLLEAGADVNVQDNWQSTPLFTAVARGHVGIVRLLLAKDKIDINLKCSGGRTALSGLARFGPTFSSSFSSDGITTLFPKRPERRWEEYEAIIKLLIAHGADLHATDNIGWTPQNNAGKDGDEQARQLFRDFLKAERERRCRVSDGRTENISERGLLSETRE